MGAKSRRRTTAECTFSDHYGQLDSAEQCPHVRFYHFPRLNSAQLGVDGCMRQPVMRPSVAIRYLLTVAVPRAGLQPGLQWNPRLTVEVNRHDRTGFPVALGDHELQDRKAFGCFSSAIPPARSVCSERANAALGRFRQRF